MLDDAALDQVMSSLGGKKVPDKDGTFWLFSIGDVSAQIMTGWPRNFGGNRVLRVGLAVSVSQPELARIANILEKRKPETWHQIEYHQVREVVPVKGDVKTCLIDLMKREIEHLRNIHLEDIIAKFEVPYPSVESKLLEQFTHLAVLAYTGNILQLAEYLNWFKQGKRYNFVRVIDQETIETAITIAEE